MSQNHLKLSIDVVTWTGYSMFFTNENIPKSSETFPWSKSENSRKLNSAYTIQTIEKVTEKSCKMLSNFETK